MNIMEEDSEMLFFWVLFCFLGEMKPEPSVAFGNNAIQYICMCIMLMLQSK